MAEERNLATARATDAAGEAEELSKSELQRRMEEARESISQTVTEIKETVTNQYNSVKESVTEALDWREQFRKRPVAFSVGALSVGFIIGYGIAGTFKGDQSDREDETNYPSYKESDAFESTGATPIKYPSYQGKRGKAGDSSYSTGRPYAAQAITGGSYGSSAYSRASSQDADESASDYRPSYSSGYSSSGGAIATEESQQEEEKPGLIERFKGTAAFDRLQTEVGNLGDRFIDELSNVGQNVVLPALIGKIKDLFGVDLANKQGQQSQVGGQSGQSTSAASSLASASRGSQTSNREASGSSAGYNRRDDDRTFGGRESGGGYNERDSRSSSSYGTSENRGYGEQSRDRDDFGRGGSNRDRERY